jgi:hypothetical protein
MSCIKITNRKRISVAMCCGLLLISIGLIHSEPEQGGASPITPAFPDNTQSSAFENLIKALRGTDSYERHRAAVALGRSGNSAAVEPLVEALEDPDYLLRSFAAEALGNLHDSRALNPLVKALADDNQRVRRSAAEALGSLRDPKALDSLVKLQTDNSVLVRRSVAIALGNLGTAEAVKPLIKALSDVDGYVSDGAVVALTNMGKVGIPNLVNALADWNLGPKVSEILRALDWQPSSDEDRVHSYVAERNRNALLNDWDTVRKVLVSDAKTDDEAQVNNAVFALVGLGQENALDDLAEILRVRNSPEIAKVFLNSGNARLSAIAREWMREHSVEIKSENAAGTVTWGSLQSS